MTLDVIGLAGFNYEFNALNPDEKPNELNSAFTTMFQAAQELSPLPVLQAWFPIFRAVPSERGRRIKVAQSTMGRIGRQLLRDSKAAVAESGEGSEKRSVLRRDLLSLLVRANTSPDILDSQRLSDDDVLARMYSIVSQ
jgi:hypothetical protein